MKSLLYLLCFIFVLSACSKEPEILKSSAEYIAEGKVYFYQSDYKDAAERFEKAILNADSPVHAEEAQRLKADSYYMGEKYLDAISAYELYYDLYDNPEYQAHVLNRIAMSYYYRTLAPKRDSMLAEKSVNYFNILKSNYPQNYEEYNAVKFHKEMIDKLAEHELIIGKYYLRTSKYNSAINRFVYIINNYGEAAILKEVYEYLLDASYEIGGREALMQDYITELQNIDPENSNIEKYRNLIN